MKLSLRWIFDHLKADWKKYSLDIVVKKFNATTAEIEGTEKVSFDPKDFALAKVIAVSKDEIRVDCPEWKKEVSLPFRDDAEVESFFVLKKEGKSERWASIIDWGGIKEKFLPAVWCEKKEVAGGWKNNVEWEDYIIEVDNKSITNRPDLWGHRGIAREFSFLLDVPFLDEKQFLAKLALKKAENSYKASKDMAISVSIKADGCRRFSAMTLEGVEHRPSVLWIAARLCRVESSPIDLIVDATNYTMLDWGQPIHAFDADAFKNKTVSIRMAKKGEKLVLLDGTKLTLTPQDIVVTDGERPVSLGGIKGGFESGVTSQTKRLLIESANFDAETVRKTAAHHKVRTDASARFEKTLDPQQNVDGTMRFVQLLKNEKLAMKQSKVLVSLGKEAKPLSILIEHDFIETRLGQPIKKNDVKKLLQKIGFSVSGSGSTYKVIVPTYRCSKDVKIKEDIVEEIVRLYGYEKIKPQLPYLQIRPSTENVFRKIRTIKQLLAFAHNIREVQNYALFDGAFLKKLEWSVRDGVILKNPLVEQSDTLVTSLVPHLLKNIDLNAPNNDELQFFEWAKTWKQTSKKEVQERQILAGIFFKKNGKVDFYEGKKQLESFFYALGIAVEWKKSDLNLQWAHAHQVADLYYGKTYLGSAGKVSIALLKKVALGDAFIFELDGDVLLENFKKESQFVELPKYQGTTLDISVEVPLSVTVSELKKAIENSDDRISEVSLVDVFKKDEWLDKKSITLRFSLRDPKKTLSKDDIEKGYKAVEKAVEKIGANIR